MARGLLGNWEQGLERLIERAHMLASDESKRKLTERAQGVIGSQMKREFRTGIGADGLPFKPRKDLGKPLVRTGTLRGSASTTIESPTRVRFGFGARYAGFVQRTRGALIPRDPPSPGPVWGPRIVGSLRQLVAKLLKGEGG